MSAGSVAKAFADVLVTLVHGNNLYINNHVFSRRYPINSPRKLRNYLNQYPKFIPLNAVTIHENLIFLERKFPLI